MSYCIYLRKSRTDVEAEAKGEGETLARHEKILLELAKKRKLNITQIHREIVSGETISARPVMQQLLTEVEQGFWKGVLVMEVERLARGDTMDQGLVSQTFKYSNTKIITPMKIYDPSNEFDEEYFEFGLFMSRREYKTINRRLQRGRIESVKEGKYLGTKPPYGYIRKKLEKEKGYTLEPHPDQADIVKLIFELYTKGEQQPDNSFKRLGVSLIVRKLNNLKIPPMKGDVWVPSTIRDMLRNPVYIGKIRWNWRPIQKKMVNGQIKRKRPRAEDYILVDGLHEAIIDIDTWNAAQEYISSNTESPVPNKLKIKNPLSGIVKCGMCGRNMVRRPHGNKYPDTIMCPVTSCKNVSSKLAKVENSLLLSLEKWLYNYKLRITDDINNNSKSIQIDIAKKAIKNLDEEKKKLENQMEKLHDLLEQEVYTVEKFLERSKNISQRIAGIEENRKQLLNTIALAKKNNEGRKNIIPKVEKVLEVYNSIEDPAERNELLKEVIEKAIYTKETGGRWSGKEDEFTLDLYPKLPK
ncbi:recombinase family protein [Crassaminicella thermophila]|uniref:recombinase family protein n=1 Tax=Crassaminicella thermophila TaxID=2599308 RepID=UPI00143D57F5|nr:recombinase family protein [Crassaminicella thermophila]